MKGSAAAPRSAVRKFVLHAAVSLVPVVILGVVLAATYHSEAEDRGVREGRTEATLIAQSAVEPVLESSRLADGLTPGATNAMWRLARATSGDHRILRLRLRDLTGKVVFSNDGTGFNSAPEDEALEAAGGEVIAILTRLNSDANDVGPAGVKAIEVYLPLRSQSNGERIGVLEIYLPYGPISDDVNAGLAMLYRNLAIGLAILYVVLFVISLSVSRGLRNEIARNKHLAEHDTLTGLPNRTLFLGRAQAALRYASRHRAPVALAIVDLDRFKEVNDTLGHHNGDRMLAVLSRRLSDHIGPGDTIARLGGDEFGVILNGEPDPHGALTLLRDVINREVEVSGLPLSVEASIGYVIAPVDGSAVDDLLQRADVAMYEAKAKHSGVVRYDRDHDHYDAAKLELVSQLRHGIEDNQLVLHYQPKTTLLDGTVDAIEALVRWQHPTLGLLSPDTFLPLAEQTDLIDKLTDWVLARALVETRRFRMVDPGLAVAVNVSARNLSRADFADNVLATLQRFDVPAHRLIIEITETALLDEPERAAAALTTLARYGVRVSLDDFGRGQTSLGYLSALPLHELKIDKSFVLDLMDNAAHAAIVRSIVDLGHNLGLRVVGEGVETEDTLALLRATGCDVAQGYLFAFPMPVDELQRWLEGKSKRPRALVSRSRSATQGHYSAGSTERSG
jgi:diguanylate cyclase (GGDEF)-like protein